MEIAEAKAEISEMLLEMKDAREKFNRDTYADHFDARYKEKEPFLMRLEKLYEEAEDKDAFIDELAEALPSSALASLEGISKQHLKDTQIMEYNFTMVTFVMPVIMKYKADYVPILTDQIIVKWGETFPKHKIQKATFEEINEGFRRKWCYITTAVCESLGKADDCYELNVLRNYRDGYLSEQENGPEQIREYYDIAPTIVNRVNKEANSEQIYKGIYESYLAPCIQLIEENRLADCRVKYRQMVESLKDEYLYS